MSRKSDYLVDSRSEEDLHRELARLAASYTPEWLFDPEDPDIGSVIGLIFTRQMAENIRRINRIPEKYRTEFVNMLGLTLLPAYPAQGVAHIGLIPDTLPGLDVPAGTKLVADGGEGENLIFETRQDIHVTAARLTHLFAISTHFGKIIPLMGQLERYSLVGGTLPAEVAPETEPAEAPQIPAFSLFDFTGEGVAQNALLLYHRNMFDTPEGVSISVRMIEGATGANIAPRFADSSRYRWSYCGQEGMVPFASVRADAEGLVLVNGGEESRKVPFRGQDHSLICLEALGPVRESVSLQALELSSACGPTRPEFVTHNEADLEKEAFMPFGDTASLFDECYIGHSSIFAQQGAVVKVEFELSFAEKLVNLSATEKEEELKIIKRRSTPVLYETARTCAQRIGLDYFNGTGWRRLICQGDYTTLLNGETRGRVELSFICPGDWQPFVIGGFEGRSLRLRILEADNCYLRPCLHNMPVFHRLQISYSYYGEWKRPHGLQRITGTVATDLTRQLTEGPVTVLEPFPYGENSIYLGFDKKIEGSPVSLLFDVQESMHFDAAPLRFEYSTKNGFAPLKALDHTGNMCRVGTVLLLPASDFAEWPVEGVRRHWIRIVDEENAYNDPERYRANIRNIVVNAVEIHNVRTLPEESFFVEQSLPGMTFPLAAENILSADVFVNEAGRLTQAAMREMLAERPEDVRVEYNFLGGISEFFVRWAEVNDFDDSGPGDRHYRLDRMDNTLIFGDGLNVMVPQAQPGVAFTVTVRCCDGARGNLPQGSVNASFGQMLYVDRIHNPTATYGGSSIESVESAHERGANILNSKNRLVSELDFVREVKAFSSSVDKVKCVIGLDPEGRRDNRIVSIAVLMKDYADGAYSFYSMQKRLREWLLRKSELSLTPETLLVTEPVFVEISLDIWAETLQAEQFFEAQNLIRRQVEGFLNPLTTDHSPGWEIGRLPTKAQLAMLFQSAKGEAGVRRFSATARYADQKGVHERSLDDLRVSPFMLATPGPQRVHMLLSPGVPGWSAGRQQPKITR